MALPATDNFTTESDQAIDDYSANWTLNNGTLTVLAATDDVRASSSDAESGAHWNADAFNDDQYGECVVTSMSSDSTHIGPAVRVAASGETYYGFYGSSNDGQLFKDVGGSWTQLGNNGSAFLASEVARIEASGTTITPYINGVIENPPGAQTDGSISSGSAGLCGYNTVASNLVDDWEGGNLGGAGPWVFGEQNPTEGETPVSWATWSDGAAGSPTISGDADWGKLELAIGEEGRSAVYDIGADGYDHIFIVNENVYGTGQGTATLQIRGSAASFNQDDGEPPNWENYTAPITRSWRYVQIRETK